MTRSLSRVLYERFVARQRVYRVYRTPDDEATRWADADRPPDVSCYDSQHPPTEQVRRLYWERFGRFRSWHLFHRLRRGRAVLIVNLRQVTLIGFGWILRGGQMQREFGWLGREIVCLGPFWTHPDYRGRGIYGMLIETARRECAARGWLPSHIWAQRDNVASIRGIEKAGFVALGTYRVSLRLCGMLRRHERLD